MRKPLSRCSLLLVLGVSLWARPTQAAEDEFVIALEPRYSMLSVPEGQRHGLGSDANVWFGINDFIWLSVAGGISYYPSSLGLDGLAVWGAHGGLVASLDVLRTIPFLEVALGVVGSSDTLDPSVRVGLGADYLINENWSIGGVARFRPLTEGLGDGLLDVVIRAAYRFEVW